MEATLVSSAPFGVAAGGSGNSSSRASGGASAAASSKQKPMNAFLLFCKRHRAIVKQKNPNLENRLISKILGEWWQSLDESEKQSFNNVAAEYKKHLMKVNDQRYQQERLHKQQLQEQQQQQQLQEQQQQQQQLQEQQQQQQQQIVVRVSPDAVDIIPKVRPEAAMAPMAPPPMQTTTTANNMSTANNGNREYNGLSLPPKKRYMSLKEDAADCGGDEDSSYARMTTEERACEALLQLASSAEVNTVGGFTVVKGPGAAEGGQHHHHHQVVHVQVQGRVGGGGGSSSGGTNSAASSRSGTASPSSSSGSNAQVHSHTNSNNNNIVHHSSSFRSNDVKVIHQQQQQQQQQQQVVGGGGSASRRYEVKRENKDQVREAVLVSLAENLLRQDDEKYRKEREEGERNGGDGPINLTTSSNCRLYGHTIIDTVIESIINRKPRFQLDERLFRVNNGSSALPSSASATTTTTTVASSVVAASPLGGCESIGDVTEEEVKERIYESLKRDISRRKEAEENNLLNGSTGTRELASLRPMASTTAAGPWGRQPSSAGGVNNNNNNSRGLLSSTILTSSSSSPPPPALLMPGSMVPAGSIRHTVDSVVRGAAGSVRHGCDDDRCGGGGGGVVDGEAENNNPDDDDDDNAPLNLSTTPPRTPLTIYGGSGGPAALMTNNKVGSAAAAAKRPRFGSAAAAIVAAANDHNGSAMPPDGTESEDDGDPGGSRRSRACKGRRYQEFKDAAVGARKGRKRSNCGSPLGGGDVDGDGGVANLAAAAAGGRQLSGPLEGGPGIMVAQPGPPPPTAGTAAITSHQAGGGVILAEQPFDVDKALNAIPALSLESFQQKVLLSRQQQQVQYHHHQQQQPLGQDAAAMVLPLGSGSVHQGVARVASGGHLPRVPATVRPL